MQSTAGVDRPSAANVFQCSLSPVSLLRKGYQPPPAQPTSSPATTLAAGVLQALLRDERQQVMPVWATKSLKFGLGINSCISCQIRLVGEAVPPLEMSLEETLL